MEVPRLTEPGFKYVLNNALGHCKTLKYKYNNHIFNVSMFFFVYFSFSNHISY